MKAIMYHYVREENKTLPHFKYLHIEDFCRQLDFFKKEFGFISKDDFLNSFKTRIPTDGVVLTFDDGLTDHYKYVLPEPVKRSIWGIFYIATSPYTTKKLLGPHRIHLLLGTHDNRKVLEATLKIVKPGMLAFETRKEFQKNTYNTIKDS